VRPFDFLITQSRKKNEGNAQPDRMGGLHYTKWATPVSRRRTGCKVHSSTAQFLGRDGDHGCGPGISKTRYRLPADAKACRESSARTFCESIRSEAVGAGFKTSSRPLLKSPSHNTVKGCTITGISLAGDRTRDCTHEEGQKPSQTVGDGESLQLEVQGQDHSPGQTIQIAGRGAYLSKTESPALGIKGPVRAC